MAVMVVGILPSISLSDSIELLRTVGPRNVARFHRLGIKTVRQLLWHFPSRYEDYSETHAILGLEPGTKANIQGEVVRISSRRIFPRRMVITDAVVRDESGAIKIVWFNQPYIADQLPEGTFVSLAGKVQTGKRGTYISSPAYEKLHIASDGMPVAPKTLKHTSGLVPVYPETEGITSKYLRFLIEPIIGRLRLKDTLPANIVRRQGFPNLQKAIRDMHFPSKIEDSDRARKRLAFDDLIMFQLRALLERRRMNRMKSHTISFDQEYVKKIISALPFELTHDQKVATWEILKDLQKSYPMNRLLEGDVGSGKTVVALIAALQTAQKGLQTVFLAPTEVLAKQHFMTVRKLIGDLPVSIGLLTSSSATLNETDVSKAAVKHKISDGSLHIVIGTHAVIQKDVKFEKLALVVIDEQHRFGVEQRSALLKHGAQNGKQGAKEQDASSYDSMLHNSMPHLLSMTATPIPRTLALSIFGDLDISIIKEKPKNRQSIITNIVRPKERMRTYQFVREQIQGGRQAFVICPRIESANDDKSKGKEAVLRTSGKSTLQFDDAHRKQTKDKPARRVRQAHRKQAQDKRGEQARLIWAEVKAVQDEYERLSLNIFPDLKVAMLHGKMKPKEKQNVMQKFNKGDTDILVSTSVVEVGVDVPNASIMLIEGADRFGLAQLHQFRGRVGRAEHQSYCLLFASEEGFARERLEAIAQCDDGFLLAERDMRMRGPGEFFGMKQSGVPDLTMASLADMELIKKARTEARLLLKQDPSLNSYPLLMARLEEFQKMHHFE